MKKILLAVTCLLPLFTQAQDKFEIAGKLIAAGNGRLVLLSYINSEGKSVKDSTKIKDGRFILTGVTAFGNLAYLELKPVLIDSATNIRSDAQEFFLEKGRTTVKGRDSIGIASISGTKGQSDYHEFHVQMDPLRAYYIKIASRYDKAKHVNDTIELKQIKIDARPLLAKMNATLNGFIESHPDSYYTADLVLHEKMQIVDDKFEPVYKSLSPRVLASFTGKKITDKYNKSKQIALGKTIDFTIPDIKGNDFTLSSLKGKYVLIDFWASWCVPCRAENPNLLKAYNVLKNKNFEIVSVSLDENKQSWLNAVAFDKMPWTQLSNVKGFKADIAVKLGITAIPQNVLIDPSGIIIAKNLRGADVLTTLSTFIK